MFIQRSLFLSINALFYWVWHLWQQKIKTSCRGMFSALFCRLLDSEKYSLTISCPAIILNFSSDCAICRFCRFLFAFLLYLHRGCLQQCNHHCTFGDYNLCVLLRKRFFFLEYSFFCNHFIFRCITLFYAWSSFSLFDFFSFHYSRNIKTNKEEHSKCSFS